MISYGLSATRCGLWRWPNGSSWLRTRTGPVVLPSRIGRNWASLSSAIRIILYATLNPMLLLTVTWCPQLRCCGHRRTTVLSLRSGHSSLCSPYRTWLCKWAKTKSEIHLNKSITLANYQVALKCQVGSQQLCLDFPCRRLAQCLSHRSCARIPQPELATSHPQLWPSQIWNNKTNVLNNFNRERKFIPFENGSSGAPLIRRDVKHV